MEKPKQTLGIISLIVAILGIFLPMAWDFYKSTAAIELQLEQFTVLGYPEEIKGLSVVYKGRELRQISKAGFVLINTGRRPITANEVIDPPTIQFPPGIEVLDAWIENTSPNNLHASVSFDSDAQIVQVDFNLLNPGDYIRFTVLTNASSIKFTATSRIVGVKSIRVVNKVEVIAEARRATPPSVYIVGFFTALAGLLVLVAIGESVKEIRFKQKLKRGKLVLPEEPRKEAYLSFIEKELSWTMEKERRPLVQLIANTPEEKLTEEEYQDLIMREIREVAANATSNVTMGFFFFVITSLGTWYVLAQIR